MIGPVIRNRCTFAAQLVLLSILLMASCACVSGNDVDAASTSANDESATTSRKADPARVVFMGDSITASWADESFFADSRQFINRGISGETATQMVKRFRADVIDLHPAAVHIMAGTNDVAENAGAERDEEIEGAIASMVEQALTHHIKVIVASIPPAKDFPWHTGLNPASRIRRLNDWLRSYAKSKGAAYLDYWPALATAGGGMKADVSDDGVHPNPEGYRRMQPLAQAAIERVLGTKD